MVDPLDMLTAPGCGLWEEETFISSLHFMRRFLISDRVQFLLSRYQMALDEELLAILHNFPAELTDSQKRKEARKKEKKNNNKKKKGDDETKRTSMATKLSKSVSQRKLKDEKKLATLSSQALEKRRMSSSGMLGQWLAGGNGQTSQQRTTEDDGCSTLEQDAWARHGGTPGRKQMNKFLSSSAKRLIQLPRSDSRPFLRAKRKNSCSQQNAPPNSDS